ncbi:hypothetical protein MRX96_009754 [Rhipicephalus microplus]
MNHHHFAAIPAPQSSPRCPIGLILAEFGLISRSPDKRGLGGVSHRPAGFGLFSRSPDKREWETGFGRPHRWVLVHFGLSGRRRSFVLGSSSPPAGGYVVSKAGARSFPRSRSPEAAPCDRAPCVPLRCSYVCLFCLICMFKGARSQERWPKGRSALRNWLFVYLLV